MLSNVDKEEDFEDFDQLCEPNEFEDRGLKLPFMAKPSVLLERACAAHNVGNVLTT